MAPHRSHVYALVLSVALLSGCRERPPEVDPVVARERAAALFAQDQIERARREIEPLLAVSRPAPEDLVRAAIVEMELSAPDWDQVETWLADAVARTPEDPAAHFNLARFHYFWGRFEEAIPAYRRTLELAPDDYPSKLRLASVLEDLGDELGDEDLTAEALELYDELAGRGVEFGGSWHRITLYRLFQLSIRAGELELAEEYRLENDTLEARGINRPTSTDLERGTFGVLQPPTVAGSRVEPAPPARLEPSAGVTTGEPPRALAFVDLEERWHELTAAERVEPVELPPGVEPRSLVEDGVLDSGQLLWIETRGLCASDAGGAPEVRVIVPGEVERFVELDLGEDRGVRDRIESPEWISEAIYSDPELVIERDGRLLLFERTFEGAYVPREEPLAELAVPVSAIVPVDLDHDGDLDLVAVGAFGGLFLRHDGADEGGGFTDDTAPLGLPDGRAFTWVVAEDLDNDQDVDLLLGGPDGAHWASSLRRGRFEDRSADLPDGVDWAREPVVADWTADRFPDLFTPQDGRLFENRSGETFAPRGSARAVRPGAAPVAVADLDLDGALDLLWIDDGGNLAGLLALGLEAETVLEPLELGARPGGALVVGDLSLAGRVELAAEGAQGIVRASVPGTEGQGVTLALKGIKDASHGVGAVVEMRTGPRYQRLYWRGDPTLLGVRDADAIDVLRVRWPNGVSQSQLDVPRGATRVFEQIEGLAGSCPFLYTWNGERFVFVSDVIGITPLGLPMGPDQLVPPDHDEYVLVTAEQLAPKDGRYVLQLTEELREVTYLDQARLIAVDHPQDSEVYPNERFCFPPFPEPHLFVVEQAHGPLAALDGNGRDWAEELSAIDERFAEPFVPHRGQYQGLADLHTLELRFDPDVLAGAVSPRLLLTGWFYWSDSSVNMAIARNPSREFLPPLLQVPDGEGGWRDTGPPIGFPAGKTKTMVLELDDLLDPADPRLRLVSTLRLYWDAIRLATCDDAGVRRESELPLLTSDLWARGYSARIHPPDQPLLEWFDWDRLDPEPRWDQHPGLYTRYGDVTPLLLEVEDHFVIFGAGDSLRLEFDAQAAPELPTGWRRDFLLLLDGWAKDRDPNAHEVEYVEPLPFHGMSGYPYGADEAYPDTPATRAYRREWNTREATRWIPDLVPRRP